MGSQQLSESPTPAWDRALRRHLDSLDWDHIRSTSPSPEASLESLARRIRASSSDVDEGWIAEFPVELLWPEAIGACFERLSAAPERIRLGAYFTPASAAREITELAVETWAKQHDWGSQPPRICDPSCGGGAFLLAAARCFASTGRWTAEDIVDSISGMDIDPTAVAITRLTLTTWADVTHGSLSLHHADSLIDDWPSEIDLVVGNPPFLGQLTAATARAPERRALLQKRFGELAAGYVDDSTLFVLRACDELRSTGGVVGMVLPRSFAGAVASGLARERILDAHHVATAWIRDDHDFDAAVAVFAPILAPGPDPEPKQAFSTALATHLATPQAHVLRATDHLGDIAVATAGFRQHFYGLQDAISDGGTDSSPRLMTAGAIDPLVDNWGHRPIRHSGSAYQRPVVEVAAIADDRVRDWVRQRLRPKVLVASQTRIIECVVDEAGETVPSVPVISVEPHDDDDLSLWLVAAVLCSPAVNAVLVRDAAGTGRSSSAIRIRAKALETLPLPANREAWETAAHHARAAQHAASKDRTAWESDMRQVGEYMQVAHGVADDVVLSWWWERIVARRPSLSPEASYRADRAY